MNTLFKALSGILAVLAVVACLATIGIIAYSVMDSNSQNKVQQTVAETNQDAAAQMTALPALELEENRQEAPAITNMPVSADHTHDYKESVETKATCRNTGRLKYTCSCGDFYYVDVPETGHVAGDWETVRKATADKTGLRVKKCIYCDEILAQEVLTYSISENGQSGAGASASPTHMHQYTTSETIVEPTCTQAGVRRYSCSCGSYYTEQIPAVGHIPTVWTVAKEATTSEGGVEIRTCSVCEEILDSRSTDKLSPSSSPGASSSPAASASASNSASASAVPTVAPSATPSATPAHTHYYVQKVITPATCVQTGVMSFTCSCGSSYAESIPINANNHKMVATITKPTSTSQGYTTHTCQWCGYTYIDSYTNK